ncbi:hypothetical protein [Paraburkholderia atlantica]
MRARGFHTFLLDGDDLRLA